MNSSHNLIGGAAAQQTRKLASEEVIESFRVLSARAKSIAEEVNVKLNPIMRPCPPATDTSPDKLCMVYPPLFAELHNHFAMIFAALDSIGDALSRTEL